MEGDYYDKDTDPSEDRFYRLKIEHKGEVGEIYIRANGIGEVKSSISKLATMTCEASKISWSDYRDANDVH